MPKTANINLRIEPDIKAQADAVFSSLGISVTDAINVFLHASIMEGGCPRHLCRHRRVASHDAPSLPPM